MKILGINSVFHESSAALVVDGEVVAACEEERFSRIKHAKEARVDNPQELPELSVRFCLDYAGLRPDDIDLVAYSRNGGRTAVSKRSSCETSTRSTRRWRS